MSFDKYKTCEHKEYELVEKHKDWGYYRCANCMALFEIKDSELTHKTGESK